MTCGARNEYNDVCGETYTCPSCRSGNEADRLCARIAELERVLEELVNSFNSVVSYSSDYYSLADYEAGIPQRWTIDAKIKSVLGRGE